VRSMGREHKNLKLKMLDEKEDYELLLQRDAARRDMRERFIKPYNDDPSINHMYQRKKKKNKSKSKRKKGCGCK